MTLPRSLGAAIVALLATSTTVDAQQYYPGGAAAQPAPAAMYGAPNGSYAPQYGAAPAAPSYGDPNGSYAPNFGRGRPAAGAPTFLPHSTGDAPIYPTSSATYFGDPSCAAPSSCTSTCDSCTSTCDSCNACGCTEEDCPGCPLRDEKVFKIFTPSDLCCFPSSIMPVTNTTMFEDPRTLTGVRAIFINQGLPGASAFGGGTFQVYALQARAALTERLSIIATKDGWIDLNPTNQALAGSGFANIAAGLKYNFWRNTETGTLLSTGMTFEIPLGAGQVFQGEGDGDFHFFLSGSTELTDRANWITGTGFRIPSDRNTGSQLWYWSNHFDVEVVRNKVFAFTEFNWYHWMSSGNGPISGFEGGDLLNLGSADVAGNDIVTAAIGPALKLRDGHIEISAAYEIPLTERRDILKDRTTVTAVINF